MGRGYFLALAPVGIDGNNIQVHVFIFIKGATLCSLAVPKAPKRTSGQKETMTQLADHSQPPFVDGRLLRQLCLS